MAIPTVEINFQKMAKDEAIEDYLISKVNKYDKLLLDATDVKATIRYHERRKYCTVIIMISLPKAVVRVEEREPDIRAAVDKAVDTLGIRLKRYKEKRKEWKGEVPWKHAELTEYEELSGGVGNGAEVVDYTPKIKRFNNYRADNIMPPAAAIETMELQGAPCYMFRNSETKKWAVVFPVGDGSYGMIETS